VLWLALAALVPLPGAPNALDDDYEPRFAGVPDAPEERLLHRLTGDGPESVEVPGKGPVLIRFVGASPIGLSSGEIEMVASGRVDSGLTLFDPGPAARGGADRVLDVDTQGSWSLEIRPVSSALYFALSPLSGSGPNVVLYPGGLSRAVDLGWESDDPEDRVFLVGGCELGSCGELGPDGSVPAGTEAIVIDASGEWRISPSEWPSEEQQPVLSGTDATLRAASD
jgi:hypothetical protein